MQKQKLNCREREAAKRKKEHDDQRHQQKEAERDKIREKYSLPSRGAKPTSQQHKKEASNEDSKCIIS